MQVCSFSLVSFSPQRPGHRTWPSPSPSFSWGQTLEVLSASLVDVDGDGDNDVVTASCDDGRIAWFENENGATRWTMHTIDQQFEDPFTARGADLDGDDDADVVVGGAGLGGVAWYENLDGHGSFGERRFVNTDSLEYNVEVVDLDDDGDFDVLATKLNPPILHGSTGWFENNGSGSFAPLQTINAETLMTAVDLDGDDDLDLVGILADDLGVAWVEHIDGSGTFGPLQVLGAGRSPLAVGDVDADGDQDVVAGYDGIETLVRFENLDGAGSFAAGVSFGQADPFGSLMAMDVEGDGDDDLLGTVVGQLVLLESDGGFQPLAVIDDTAGEALESGDLDGDEEPDLIVSFHVDGVGMYRNLGSGDFGPLLEISSPAPRYPYATIGDLDGDDDLDLVAGGDSGSIWLENTDGLARFDTHHEISIWVWAIVDLDRDGDQDLISQNSWQENLDGSGTFADSVSLVVTDGSYKAAGDLDGDDDLDLVLWSSSGLVWHANAGGEVFGVEQTIDATLGSFGVAVVDLDDDGDLDLVTSSHEDPLAWYENLDGSGNFASAQAIGSQALEGTAVLAVDVDGDDDVDVIHGEPLGWYENLDGGGAFGPLHSMDVPEVGIYSFAAADLDGDADLDVVAGAELNDASIVWYENIGGANVFDARQEIREVPRLCRPGVSIGDLDGDSDPDVIVDDRIGTTRRCGSGGGFNCNSVSWHENLLVSDADGDGALDPDDNCPLNANPTQLDADGDGEGDACDLCTDTDADSYGDPGHPASICPQDNCPDDFNPDQRETDGDGPGDLCDPCPADATDTCDPTYSAAESVGPGGGTVSTPDGSVTVIIPPGALAEETSIAITGLHKMFVLENDEEFIVTGVRIDPDGMSFTTPVTIIFAWPDDDDDGFVDGAGLDELTLRVSRVGDPFTAICAVEDDPASPPYCDTSANTFTIEVDHFSEYRLFAPCWAAGKVCTCGVGDPDVYPRAPEINDGRDNQCPGDPGFGMIDELSGSCGFESFASVSSFIWSAQQGATLYQVLRGDGGEFDGSCAYVTTPAARWDDPEEPAPGAAFYYVVRPLLSHGGSWGGDASGVERAPSCSSARHVFTFVDTFEDDLPLNALPAYFGTFEPLAGDWILFEIEHDPLDVNAWCATRADAYRQAYLDWAMGGGILYAQGWERYWRHAGTGFSWSGPETFSATTNMFGGACRSWPGAWCSEQGLGGYPSRTIDPVSSQLPGACEVYDQAAGGCGSGSWRLTIRVAATSAEACGL